MNTKPTQLLAQALELHRAGRKPQALAAYRRFLALQPEHAEAWAQVAGLLRETGQLLESSHASEQALRLHPGHPGALIHLANAQLGLGQWQGFAEAYRQIIGQQGHPPAIEAYDLGLLDLRMGRLASGWQRYESRWQCPGLIGPVRNFPQPRWDGSPFPGQTLLVFHEQGLGDTFMFIRYAAQVQALGGRVVFEVQRSLAEVVATCPGVAEVVAHGQPLPPFDLQVPLLSLPGLFGTELDSIPADCPYLDVPAAVPAQAALATRLAESHGQVRIGLCWSGSPSHKKNGERSLAPALLAPLAALPGVAWHSFQFDARELPPLPGLVTFGGDLAGFSNTAYALSAMDLVITVDTVLAHLAGAMAIPTLLLLSFLPDWRWLMGREDSPWYPSLRLLRQPRPGDWEAVIQRVVAELGADQ